MKKIGIYLLSMLFTQLSWGSEVRFKTYVEYFASLEAATNISGKNQIINSFYLNRRDSLPATGKLNELSALGITAAMGLTSLFCDKMIAKDSTTNTPAARWANGSIDFTLSPEDAFTSSVKKELLNTYAELFWQRDLTAAEFDIFDKMLSNFIKEMPKNADSTKSILLSTCTVFGATLESLIGLSN